ncbi:UDP-N-acetylmuramate dehydrogenase [bacterium]|nr:UDP-N-acetylmuramate dehydrogenase [bacterium]
MNITPLADLSLLNTFGLPSIAERLVSVRSQDEIAGYFESGEPHPTLVLGGGSNLLLTKDIPGTVLKIEVPGVEVISESDDHVFVKVGSGEVWHNLVLNAIANNWGGIENLSLIPGNVGTAPMQNIGAYGTEIKSVFHELDAYLTEDRSWKTFGLDECNFGYRESVFKRKLKNKAVIGSVTFKLNKKHEFNTQYGAIEQELERMGVNELSLKTVSDAVINIRQSKLPDPKQIGNSGSFFKNPVIAQNHFEKLQNEFDGIVGYPAGEAKVKVAAGWLIERAGFKGKRIGNYGVHDRQALVLVNHGGAKGIDIYNLSEEIIAAIKSQFNIELEREVNVI